MNEINQITIYHDGREILIIKQVADNHGLVGGDKIEDSDKVLAVLNDNIKYAVLLLEVWENIN